MSNAGPKILYIEDSPSQRQIITLVLKRQGFVVQTAGDGREGVALAQAWLPDLILMDLMMPKMNGFEASRTLRADPLTRHIPIVAYSARPEREVRAWLQAAGIDNFVSKTAPPADLVTTLKAYLPVCHRE